MKKVFLTLLILMTGFLIAVFVRPQVILNPKVLAFVLNQSKIFRSWSWSNAVMEHRWEKWNQRKLFGHFKNFCFDYKKEGTQLNTCLENVSWDFRLHFNLKDGFYAKTIEPFRVLSAKTDITLYEKKTSTSNAPLDIHHYWRMLWHEAIPDMEFAFLKINLKRKDANQTFDLKLVKQQRYLEVESWILRLTANSQGFVVTMPEKYRLPSKFGIKGPLYLKDLKLEGTVKERGIPLLLNGNVDALSVKLTSFLDLPLKKNIFKSLLLNSKADLHLAEVKNNLKRIGPRPYNELPAPLNAMNGNIHLNANVLDLKGDDVLIQGLINFNLKSKKQALVMRIKNEVEFDTVHYGTGAILLGLDFDKVALQLPRFDRKSLPPQMIPDNRIKTRAQKQKIDKKRIQAEEEKPSLVHLEAKGKKALHILTELLDEALRLNFDLLVQGTEIQRGTIDVLPLKTKVFRRPVHILSLRFTFNHPLPPVIKGKILFPLPEYKITLTLQGPVTRPGYALTSDPPLPQSDIYSVLLFGRPMSELNPDESMAAGQSSSIMGQGFLSLSVLYFLAGSPVEYIGFDRDTGGASAQISLGSRSSVTVGGNREGWTGTSLRRSLGKGWFLDTTVGNSTQIDSNRQSAYGVLIERILAY